MEQQSPKELGLDPKRLEMVFSVAQRLVDEGLTPGGAFLVARHGRIAAARGIGTSEPGGKGFKISPDTIFTLFSATKPLSAVPVLQRIERGELRLWDKVSDFIPEFAKLGKRNITIGQCLTHTAGFPTLALDWRPTKWADWDATINRICDQPLEFEPGTAVHYHGVTAQWIGGEVVRRLEDRKRSYAQILAEDVFRPLGMSDTYLGVTPEMDKRRAALNVCDPDPASQMQKPFLEAFNHPEVKPAAVPGGGGNSTVLDMARFYQAMMNGGALEGFRVLAPATLKLATTIHTGAMEDRLFEPMRYARSWNRFPANRGLAFWVRGEGIFPSCFGNLTSARTFGHPGAGSTMAWADPERELVFVGLTNGPIEEVKNIRRFDTLSDLVVQSIVD